MCSRGKRVAGCESSLQAVRGRSFVETGQFRGAVAVSEVSARTGKGGQWKDPWSRTSQDQ